MDSQKGEALVAWMIVFAIGGLVTVPMVVKIVKDMAHIRRERRKEEPRDL